MTITCSLLCCVILFASGRLDAEDVTQHVDPFIGTANGGNTLPGAVIPWGMVSVSPHNAPRAPSGYIKGGEYFYGFGHLHLSGTGCAELGSIVLMVSPGGATAAPQDYRCTYDNEKASPGFYSIFLREPGIRAEVTATARCGFTRFIPQRNEDFIVSLDAGRSLGLTGGGSVRFVTTTEVEGFNTAGGLCGEANRERIYFVARFSRPPLGKGVWIGRSTDGDEAVAADDSALGCWFRFPGTQSGPLLVKVGISLVSTENARLNLDEGIPAWDFQEIRERARSLWKRELEKILVEGGSVERRVKFYTALYHSLIHPNIISDVNGEYPLMGRKGIGRSRGRDRYSVFSLWDTYRTLHPLLTLVYPERQSAIVRTMIDMYRESQFLPKWELAGNETYLMAGDPGSIVVADTYVSGILDSDTLGVYAGAASAAFVTKDTDSPPVRAGYHEFVRYGYIPFEQDTTKAWWVWGPVSTTLEYCLADWALSRAAEKAGRTHDAERFLERSLFYRNMFDPTTQFMRPRSRNGTWVSPFDPLATEGSGSWAGSGGPGFVEGDAWQYTWFVPHDIPGLIGLFGGGDAFARKLDSCFTTGQFTINNEPDIGFPYLFNYAPGWEWRTAGLLRTLMDSVYGTGPGGLPGNDDAGTISAWFVFSALGFYPDCPASATYELGTPLFDAATIRLNPAYYPGREFVVRLMPRTRTAKDSAQARLNGVSPTGRRIPRKAVTSGGELIFYE